MKKELIVGNFYFFILHSSFFIQFPPTRLPLGSRLNGGGRGGTSFAL
jgi:hypothetical protein